MVWTTAPASAELNLAQPQKLALYTGISDSLAAVTSYDRSAQTIINRVIDGPAPEAPEDGE